MSTSVESSNFSAYAKAGLDAQCLLEQDPHVIKTIETYVLMTKYGTIREIAELLQSSGLNLGANPYHTVRALCRGNPKIEQQVSDGIRQLLDSNGAIRRAETARSNGNGEHWTDKTLRRLKQLCAEFRHPADHCKYPDVPMWSHIARILNQENGTSAFCPTKCQRAHRRIIRTQSTVQF